MSIAKPGLLAESSRPSAPPILAAALDYHAWGLCVIPIRPGTKLPAVQSWEPYQAMRPKEAELRQWFDKSDPPGLAIVLGEVSGNVVARDFDAPGSYEAWAEAHPDLARTLPTVRTGDGWHVYCRAAVEQIRNVGTTGKAYIKLGNGELRLNKCYCLAPPSRHENGNYYQWHIEPNGDFSFVDLVEAGFLPCNRVHESTGANRELQSLPRIQSNQSVPSKQSPPSQHTTCLQGTLSTLLHEQIEVAIERTIPIAPRKRHELVFRLCRELQGIPGLIDLAEDDQSILRPFVYKWHERGKQFITSPPEETWFDFVEGWSKVKFPAGEELVARLFEQSAESEAPEPAQIYDQIELHRLVFVCRELQRTAGEAEFFLSCRTVEKHLDVDHTTAARWLRFMQRDGILNEVEKGSPKTGRASRYKYLHPLS